MGIVPHTHWDREWYTGFQAGRVRLVRILDGLLDDLDAGRIDHFLLDGQTAVIDDYLAVRPQALPRVEVLVAAGRLGIGPWTVPMDEFVLSAETIVRNLQAGLRRAGSLGAAGPAVGYCPDVFGHVAQLPQILRLAGITHAVVWRGVPAAVAGVSTAFRWEAPDGSSVRAEYLFGSYANGRNLPADGPGLVARAASFEAEVGARRVDGLLLMNGGDQRAAEPWVTGAVTEANAAGGRYRFEVTHLARWLASQPGGAEANQPLSGRKCPTLGQFGTEKAQRALPVWRGELRSSAGAPLLAGVISNRVDVRAAAAAAERAVERRAEPLLALFRPPEDWEAAAPLLALAWERLIANSAHDSACACCSDEVAHQVLARYAEAAEIGDALADQVLADLAAEADAPPGAVLVVNPGAAPRPGLVEVTVDGTGFVGPDGHGRATQHLASSQEELFAATVTGAKVGWVADRIVGGSFAGHPVREWSLDDGVLRFEAGAPGSAGTDLDGARRSLLALGAEGATVTVRMDGPVRHRILVDTGAVPGFGWTTLLPARAEAGPVAGGVRIRDGAGGGLTLDNGIVRVDVDASDGTFGLTTLDGLSVAGLNRYVDAGDVGDTYTWEPPDGDTIVERPGSVTVSVGEAGPLRATAVITATYRWPARQPSRFATHDAANVLGSGGEGANAVVTTTVSLEVGADVVSVDGSFDNRGRDHRLRVHFPLPAPVAGSDAGCAFAVVCRGLTAEGGPAESPPPTFPARRFVDCSAETTGGAAGLAFMADGTFEYEVCDGGRELAVTLLRATGWLSRRRLARRPDPAGPAVPVEGAQVQGRRHWRYGLLLHLGAWDHAAVDRRAEAWRRPLEAVVTVPGGTSSARRGAMGGALRVEGALVSSVRRDRGAILVRLYNPRPVPALATVAGPDGGGLAGVAEDLRGAPMRSFMGTLELRAGEIATVRLSDCT